MATFDEQFAKMKKAPLRRGGGNWIKGPGVFDVEILSVTRKMGWNKSFTVRDKELFIVEFKIHSVQSTDPIVQKDHAAGTTASWTCKDPSEGNFGDVKCFCVAVAGVDPRSVKDSDDETHNLATLLALAALGEAEAFKRLEQSDTFFVGKRVTLETKTVPKKDGSPFTKHIWSPADAPAEPLPY